MSENYRADLIINVQANIRKAQDRLKELVKPSTIIKYKEQIYGLNKQLERLGSRPFQAWALSIMFAGMAIQRTFDNIWKTGTKTFNDVMHSVEGNVTAFDILDGSIKYLQFSIGSALEPVVGYLIPIIDAITDWINANPELFRGIFMIGSVLGTIFTVGGGGYLALQGFEQLFGILAINKLGGIAAAFNPIGAAIAAAAVAMGVYAINVNKNPMLKAEFSNSILKPLSKAWDELVVSIKSFFEELSKNNGVLDYLGGILYVIGGILVTVLAVAINVVVQALKSLFNAWSAVFALLSGDSSSAQSYLKKVYDMTTLIENATSALGNAMTVINDASNGGFTLSGLAGVNSQKTHAANYYSTMDDQMQGLSANSVINNYYISGVDIPKALDEAKRYSSSNIPNYMRAGG